MKVLHVIPSIAVSHGGPTEVVRRLHAELPKLGIESRILTTDKDLSAEDVSSVSSLDVSVLRSGGPKRLNYGRGVTAALIRALPEADVVHVHSVDTLMSTIAARMAVRTSTPLVIQPHGAYDAYHRDQGRLRKEVWHQTLDARCFSQAAAVVASSTREASGIADKLKSVPIETIPLGVDPGLFGGSSEPLDHILFLGRLTPKKRVDIAIRAFALSGVHRSGAQLVVAGPLDPRLDYSPSEIARQAGVEGSVVFEGVVDERRRRDLLRQARLFILPSEDESFGVSVAEAMAAGVCVVASTEVGVAADVERHRALVTAPPEQGAFASAIAALWADDANRASVAETGKRYAESNFDWANIADRFGQLYERAGGLS